MSKHKTDILTCSLFSANGYLSFEYKQKQHIVYEQETSHSLGKDMDISLNIHAEFEILEFIIFDCSWATVFWLTAGFAIYTRRYAFVN